MDGGDLVNTPAFGLLTPEQVRNSGPLVIAGGSGFIGKEITQQALEMGLSVIHLTRSDKPSTQSGITNVQWDGINLGEWINSLSGASAVINLSGRSVAAKWTFNVQKEIVSSRVESTRAIGNALSQVANAAPRWVNASAVGIYGNRPGEMLDESSSPGPEQEFLVDCCRQWEHAARSSCPKSIRLSFVRVGIVLGWGGGSFPILHRLTQFGLGGKLGSGTQGQSWIHVRDIAKMFLWSAYAESPTVVNGTAPIPVSQEEFMATMRQVIGRPWTPPAPAFFVQMASLFGAPDASLVLDGQFARPQAALDAGFTFEFSQLSGAISDLIATKA